MLTCFILKITKTYFFPYSRKNDQESNVEGGKNDQQGDDGDVTSDRCSIAEIVQCGSSIVAERVEPALHGLLRTPKNDFD